MKCRRCGIVSDRHALRCGKCNAKILKIDGLLVATIGSFMVICAIIFAYFATDVFDANNENDIVDDYDPADYDNGIVDNYERENDDVIDIPETTADLFAAAGPGSDIHGALHRIEYEDNVVYLFGTMHAAAPEWFPLANIVEDAMRRADVFAFEFDMTLGSVDLEEILAVMDLLNEGMYLPGDQTLAEVIPADIHASLVEHIESFNRTYEDVRRINPIALAMQLQLEAAAEVFADFGIYYDVQMGVDGYILNFAQSHEVPVIGLEPLLQQAKIGFAPSSEILELAGFDGSLEDIMYDVFSDEFIPRAEMLEMLREEVPYTYNDYLHNNLEDLILGMDVIEEDLENEFIRYTVEVLMNFRSTYYAERIVELLQNTDEPTTYFVAVGISHVIRTGDNLTNIVEQLQLRGITAIPIYE